MTDGSNSETSNDRNVAESKPICGLIMPISKTSNHAEHHWADVQSLLHRAIAEAGFTPRNVWENSATDRISKRIIGNLFEYPIIIADISDLNPNVMLELGLRLSSKKPTVVIVNNGGEIPFDIRDFHALPYPSDTGMTAMEAFFRELGLALTSKYQAYIDGKYAPFLGDVIVDVVPPTVRQTSYEGLILSAVEDLSRRLNNIEANDIRPLPVSNMNHSDRGLDEYNLLRDPYRAGQYFHWRFTVPNEKVADALRALQGLGHQNVHVFAKGASDSGIVASTPYDETDTDRWHRQHEGEKVITELGGSRGSPDPM